MKNLLLATAFLFAAAVWGEVRTAELGFAGYTGQETLTDFPALIKLPDAVAGFASAEAGTNGENLWFTDADGNVLAHEIDLWNAEGKSYVWVKVPQLTAATKITLHWGAPPPADAPSATSVWTGYTGVWHMNAASSAAGTKEPDATGNGLDATPERHPTSAVSRMEEVVAEPFGKIGTCVNNQQSSVTRNALVVPAYWDKMTDVSVMTVGGWFRQGRRNGWSRLLSAKRNTAESTGWETYTNSGSSEVISGCGSAAQSAYVSVSDFLDQWVHVQYVYNGTSIQIYTNGRLCGTLATTPIRARTDGLGFTIGCNPTFNEYGWCGFYDEVRLYDGALSADRIKAEYDTARDPVGFVKGGQHERTADLYTSGYTGSETLSDLPVQVVFPDGVPGFDYNDATVDGRDIWFSDADGNALASECDMWKSSTDSSKSVFWVKVPQVTRSTKITVHWGGTPPATRPAATETWAGYVGVWHLGTATGKPLVNEPDATGHGFDAVPTSSNSNKISQIKSRWTGGLYLYGPCAQIQTELGKLNGLTVTNYASRITNPSQFTIAGWFYAEQNNGYSRLFSAQKRNCEGVGWEVWHNNGPWGLGMTGSYGNTTVGTVNMLGKWVHVLVVYNGSTAQMYVDGRLVKTGSTTAVKARSDAYGFVIGGSVAAGDKSFVGCADEVRLYDGVASADRVWAVYQTQKNPTGFLRTTTVTETSIREEVPTYGNRFNGAKWMRYMGTSGSYELWGYGEERLGFSGQQQVCQLMSPAGGAIGTTDKGPSGSLTFGTGDWTQHIRLQSSLVQDGPILLLGVVSTTSTGLLLLSDGTNGVALVTAHDGGLVSGSRLAVPVDRPTFGYHDYALVFHAATKVVDCYVDGVLKGSLAHPNYNSSEGYWGWIGRSDGLGPSPAGARLEDVRFYRRALTAAELTTLHQELSGDAAAHPTYAATVTHDMPFSELEWTPAPPSGVFARDAQLTVTFAAPGKALYLWDVPQVARVTVKGCAGASDGAAGRLVEMSSYPARAIDLRLEDGVFYDAHGHGNGSYLGSPYATLAADAAMGNTGLALSSGRSEQASGCALAPGATAFLQATSEMGLIGFAYYPYWVNLNDGRLTKRGAADCWLANTTVFGPGTLEVAEGRMIVFQKGFTATGAAVEVAAGATLDVRVASAIDRLAGAGTVTVVSGVVARVTGTLAGTLNLVETAGVTNAVQVAAGATLDLEGNTAPFAQPASLQYLGSVKVIPPGRAMYYGRKRLIAWSAPPAGEEVTFVSEGTARALKLSVEATGLWIDMSGTLITIR